MLSTVHMGEMISIGKENFKTGERIMKPDVVMDYTENMHLADKSDMMISFVECIRKTVQWYNKLIFT